MEIAGRYQLFLLSRFFFNPVNPVNPVKSIVFFLFNPVNPVNPCQKYCLFWFPGQNLQSLTAHCSSFPASCNPVSGKAKRAGGILIGRFGFYLWRTGAPARPQRGPDWQL
jgi:hypothetical protein